MAWPRLDGSPARSSATSSVLSAAYVYESEIGLLVGHRDGCSVRSRGREQRDFFDAGGNDSVGRGQA
jgi:hypothetical protein